MGPNLSEDLFFAPRLILGAQHQSSYPLKKFLSEALVAQDDFDDLSSTSSK